MIFSSRKPLPRWLGVVAASAAAALLVLGTASCGGETGQKEVFVPGRLLVFGDDDSVITQSGRKYSVNGLSESGEFDCLLQPIWVQQMAALYGFVFAECNPGAVSDPKAKMLAGVGARVADVAAQVEAQLAAGGFRDSDLATMLAGANDIFDLYRQYPAVSEDTLTGEAEARGRRLAQVVNRLVSFGVKVVVSDLPDLGMTPYALSERALGGTSFDRAALISRLTQAFNAQLGVNIVLDGRYVGLVQSMLQFVAISRSPGSYGLANITQGVCAVGLPECTTATLVQGGVPAAYLWADQTRMAAGGHAQLAGLAAARAQNNPF